MDLIGKNWSWIEQKEKLRKRTAILMDTDLILLETQEKEMFEEIQLRVEKTKQEFNNSKEDSGNQSKKFNILIVEDDEISAKLFQIIVKTLANKTLLATTGNEAINICLENIDIDLILMDIALPDLSGYEVTKQIRQFNREVVIIAQTSYGMFGDREKAIAAGCNDYLSKPINIKELRSKINEHCK